MTQTTIEQRQEWKRLRTEAETEYPWKSERGTQNGKGWVIPQANPYHDGEFCYHTKPIAKFIESAYVAVPALLSDLDAAEAEIERLREELSAHTRDLSGDDHFDSNEAVAQLLDAEILFVGTSRGHTTLYVICNDLFAWGLADAEPFSTADIPDLYSAWKSGEWGVEKWCCKRRNMQPQPPVKRSMIEDGAWDESMESLPQNPSARTALENKP